jgi:hypothetical protein
LLNTHLKKLNTHSIAFNFALTVKFVQVGYLCDFFLNTPSAMMGCLFLEHSYIIFFQISAIFLQKTFIDVIFYSKKNHTQ